jgi:hypothetical protein
MHSFPEIHEVACNNLRTLTVWLKFYYVIKLWVLLRIIGGIMFISLSFTRIAQAGWKGNFINCFWNVCICLSVNVRKLLHATSWISGKLCIYWIKNIYAIVINNSNNTNKTKTTYHLIPLNMPWVGTQMYTPRHEQESNHNLSGNMHSLNASMLIWVERCKYRLLQCIHLCAYPRHVQWYKVIGGFCFVGIIGIVDHYCIYILFIRYRTYMMLTKAGKKWDWVWLIFESLPKRYQQLLPTELRHWWPKPNLTILFRPYDCTTEAPKTIETIFSYISMCLVFFPIKPVYKSEWSIIK